MLKDTRAFKRTTSTLESLNRPGYSRLAPQRARILKISQFLAILILVLIVWDFFLATNGTDNDTWSEQVRSAAPRIPFVPWILGAMVGHVFPVFGPRTFIFEPDAAGPFMGLLSLAVAVWSLLILMSLLAPIAPAAIWAIAILGLCGSYLFWPMGTFPPGEAR